MRHEFTTVSVSWIPSESVSGLLRGGFDGGVAHYDEPPPDHVTAADVDELRAADRLRFANVLSAWMEVEGSRVTAYGWNDGAGLVMGGTTVRLARLEATFRGYSLPVLRPEPVQGHDRVSFTQTVGGRTGAPLPRPVKHSSGLDDPCLDRARRWTGRGRDARRERLLTPLGLRP